MRTLNGALFLALAVGAAAGPLEDAIDATLQLESGAQQPSHNAECLASMRTLLLRSNLSSSALELRHNTTDADLLRLALLASIALISPWDQDPETGRFLLTERGILLEAYHPSTSESDIMLCVVCALLAIIVMFHIAEAQPPQRLPDTLLHKGS